MLCIHMVWSLCEYTCTYYYVLFRWSEDGVHHWLCRARSHWFICNISLVCNLTHYCRFEEQCLECFPMKHSHCTDCYCTRGNFVKFHTCTLTSVSHFRCAAVFILHLLKTFFCLQMYELVFHHDNNYFWTSKYMQSSRAPLVYDNIVGEVTRGKSLRIC